MSLYVLREKSFPLILIFVSCSVLVCWASLINNRINFVRLIEYHVRQSTLIERKFVVSLLGVVVETMKQLIPLGAYRNCCSQQKSFILVSIVVLEFGVDLFSDFRFWVLGCIPKVSVILFCVCACVSVCAAVYPCLRLQMCVASGCVVLGNRIFVDMQPFMSHWHGVVQTIVRTAREAHAINV